MKKQIGTIIGILFTIVTILLLTSNNADAVPSFARQVGQSCSLCHYAFPKLNAFGMQFKYDGFRTAETRSKNVWELKTIPLSAVAEVEGEVNWDDLDNEKTLKLDEVEVFLATPIAEHFSVFGEIEFKGGESEPETLANIQFDSLTSTPGQLNVAAGNHIALDWPHLSHMRRVIHNRYLAQAIGFLLDDETGVEINGQRKLEGTLSSYRYNIGITRDDNVNSSNKFKSVFGTITFGIQQHYIGLHYRYAEENQSTGKDVVVNRVGISGEAYIGPVVITPAYYYANFDEYSGTADELKAHNFMAEALYKVNNNLVVGVREDYLKADQGSNDGHTNAISVNATYYFTPNIYLGGEYRHTKQDNLNTDPAGHTVSNIGNYDQTEQRLRAFLVAAF